MEYGTLFNKNDYIILEIIIGNECSTPYKSVSTKFIIEKSKYSHVKVRQVLKNFILSDFIREGARDGNNKTYYYTQKGLDYYKTAMGYSDLDIEDLVEENKEN